MPVIVWVRKDFSNLNKKIISYLFQVRPVISMGLAIPKPIQDPE